MKRNLILLIASLAILFSCSEDNEYTVTLKEAGNLTVQLNQNEIAISGETVYLIPESSAINKDTKSLVEYAIDYKETDENGNVDFGEVNSGNYYVATDGIEISGKTYYPTKITQVVSGGTREVTMDVMDYTGTIELTVVEYDYYYDYVPVSGIKVAILNENDYYSASSFDDWMDSKIEESTTDSNGEVTFTLPSGMYYVAIVYTTDSYGDVSNYDTEYLTYLDMDEEYNETIQVYFK